MHSAIPSVGKNKCDLNSLCPNLLSWTVRRSQSKTCCSLWFRFSSCGIFLGCLCVEKFGENEEEISCFTFLFQRVSQVYVFTNGRELGIHVSSLSGHQQCSKMETKHNNLYWKSEPPSSLTKFRIQQKISPCRNKGPLKGEDFLQTERKEVFVETKINEKKKTTVLKRPYQIYFSSHSQFGSRVT